MQRYLLFGVVLLALFLRVFNLSNVPAGFTPDEASFGYDAYSLINTGKDQWGNSWPMSFKSFGDYKLPVYTYLTIPFVYLLGLNEFSVRLPSAILGSFAVLLTFFLVKELDINKIKFGKYIPIFTSFCLAISYWHVALSRGAFEANLTSFFLTLGIYLFLAARKKQWLLVPAMLVFGINLFTYHTARIVTPAVVMSLLWFYRTEFPRRKKYTLASFVFLSFFVVSIFSLFSGGGSRINTSTVFSQNLGSGNERASVVAAGTSEILGRALYNEPLFKVEKIIKNYVSYFSPQFLLTEGALEATYGMVPGIGVISFLEFSGFILFFIFLLKTGNKNFYFLVLWIFLSAIPASITVGPGNAANRVSIMMPAIQIASSVGLFYLLQFFKIDRNSIIVFIVGFTAISCLSLAKYYIEQPTKSSEMVYGMRELFSVLKQYPEKQIVLSRSISEPHIYVAFYEKVNPLSYQNSTKTWNFSEKGLSWVDQQEGYLIGRYKINTIDKIRDFMSSNTLVVGKPNEMPENAKIVQSILTPDRKVLWVITEKP